MFLFSGARDLSRFISIFNITAPHADMLHSLISLVLFRLIVVLLSFTPKLQPKGTEAVMKTASFPLVALLRKKFQTTEVKAVMQINIQPREVYVSAKNPHTKRGKLKLLASVQWSITDDLPALETWHLDLSKIWIPPKFVISSLYNDRTSGRHHG